MMIIKNNLIAVDEKGTPMYIDPILRYIEESNFDSCTKFNEQGRYLDFALSNGLKVLEFSVQVKEYGSS